MIEKQKETTNTSNGRRNVMNLEIETGLNYWCEIQTLYQAHFCENDTPRWLAMFFKPVLQMQARRD